MNFIYTIYMCFRFIIFLYKLILKCFPDDFRKVICIFFLSNLLLIIDSWMVNVFSLKPVKSFGVCGSTCVVVFVFRFFFYVIDWTKSVGFIVNILYYDNPGPNWPVVKGRTVYVYVYITEWSLAVRCHFSFPFLIAQFSTEHFIWLT